MNNSIKLVCAGLFALLVFAGEVSAGDSDFYQIPQDSPCYQWEDLGLTTFETSEWFLLSARPDCGMPIMALNKLPNGNFLVIPYFWQDETRENFLAESGVIVPPARIANWGRSSAQAFVGLYFMQGTENYTEFGLVFWSDGSMRHLYYNRTPRNYAVSCVPWDSSSFVCSHTGSTSSSLHHLRVSEEPGVIEVTTIVHSPSESTTYSVLENNLVLREDRDRRPTSFRLEVRVFSLRYFDEEWRMVLEDIPEGFSLP